MVGKLVHSVVASTSRFKQQKAEVDNSSSNASHNIHWFCEHAKGMKCPECPDTEKVLISIDLEVGCTQDLPYTPILCLISATVLKCYSNQS